MEEFVSNETVKQSLIVAGLKELELHGTSDFSLRRVAAASNVSCAAPYKHFKDKEHFINEIIGYVDSQWRVLYNQLIDIFCDDTQKQLVEICVAFVKFCIGNSHFRAVFIRNAESHNGKLPIENDITCIAKKLDIPSEKIFKITSLVIGAVMLTGSDTKKNEQIIEQLKNSIISEM